MKLFCCLIYNSIYRDFSVNHIQSHFSILKINIAEAAGCGKKASKIADFRIDVQAFFSRIIADTSERLDERVAGQGPGIPVPRFIFIEGVAYPAVIPAACSLNDLQALIDIAGKDEMRSDLVFHARPDFVFAVDEGCSDGLSPRGHEQSKRPPSCPSAKPGRCGLLKPERSFLKLFS